MPDHILVQEALQASVCKVLMPSRGAAAARVGQVTQSS